jgi:electron transfer flavoprotein alpha subunit
MSVLVFADAPEGKLVKSVSEAVYYGKLVADKLSTDVTVITYGSVDASALEQLGSYGASKVLVNRNITEDNDQSLTQFVAAAVEKEGSKVVIFSNDPLGRALAPRLSARLEAGLVTGATDVPDTDGDKFVLTKGVFSGKAFGKFAINTDVKIISLMPNSFQPEKGEGSAEVEEFSPEVAQGKLKMKERKETGGEGIPLTEADLVVSAGRGLKGPENWEMVEELAKEMGAATACSRPVADMEWRPHHEHVGQTGIAIRPNLYLAAGISGAIQHLAGVNQSKTIVVVNTDPEAPFFKEADYGVIGDAFEVLPRLTEAIKKFKAE